LIYVDTSAFFKLVKDDEPEGPSMHAYIKAMPSVQFVSSTLLTIEARRGTLRASPRNLPRVDLLLSDVVRIPISDAVIESASRLPDPLLRSLDAIHLATALLIREDIDALLTYDEHLATAARAHGIEVAAPA
jgi:predicted nucleic acid-binding protein